MRTTPLATVCCLLALACCAGCTAEERPAGAASEPADEAPRAPDPRALRLRADAAVADPGRPEEDRTRDPDRRPAEILAFCGTGAGARVVDIQATGGYYTELLSTVVGEAGTVYAHNNGFVLERFAREPLETRLARLGRDHIERLDTELSDMRLPSGLDAALLVRFYHDLFWLPDPAGPIDRAAFNRQVFEALRPGGVFCVVDHHAEAGSGERDAVDPQEGLHRVDAELVRQEIEAAGFELAAESDVLRNPDDTRDWNIFADDAARRDRTDRFIYRFRKPGA